MRGARRDRCYRRSWHFSTTPLCPPLNLLDFHAKDLKHYSVIEVSPLFLFAGSTFSHNHNMISRLRTFHSTSNRSSKLSLFRFIIPPFFMNRYKLGILQTSGLSWPSLSESCHFTGFSLQPSGRKEIKTPSAVECRCSLLSHLRIALQPVLAS